MIDVDQQETELPVIVIGDLLIGRPVIESGQGIMGSFFFQFLMTALVGLEVFVVGIGQELHLIAALHGDGLSFADQIDRMQDGLDDQLRIEDHHQDRKGQQEEDRRLLGSDGPA